MLNTNYTEDKNEYLESGNFRPPRKRCAAPGAPGRGAIIHAKNFLNQVVKTHSVKDDVTTG